MITMKHWVTSIETYAYRTNEKIMHKKEENEWNRIIKEYKND